MKKRVRQRYLMLYCLLLTFCLRPLHTLAAQDSADTLDETTASDSVDSLSEEDAQTMLFTDVLGMVHTLVIDPGASMTEYDPGSFSLDGQEMIYTDTSRYICRSGIDVSYYQGDIDWDSVKEAGYEFAFLRAGYRGYSNGSLIEDSQFSANLEGARNAGLEVGIYFFSQAVTPEEAVEEANFVLALLDGAELDLPIVYDPEFILDAKGNKIAKARTSGLTGEQITENTLAFCETIETAGYESAVYTNLLSESEVFDMTALSDCTIWYADYNAVPQTPYAFTFWQYSASGSVPGISGAVDLNIELLPAD